MLVPRYGDAIKQAAGPNVTQSISTNEDMFGAGVGKAASKFGQGLEKSSADLQVVIEKSEKDLDSTALMEFENSIRDWENENLWDEKNGIYNRKGKDSFGSDVEAKKKFGASFDKYIDDADFQTPEARQKAMEYLERRRDQVTKDVGRHIAGQRDVYDQATFTASIAGHVEDAAKYYNDPQKIKMALAGIRVKTRKESDRFGRDPAVTMQAIEKNISLAHKSILERMIANKDASAAAEYLEANKDEIDGADIAKLENDTRKVGVDVVGAELAATFYDPDKKVGDIVKEIEAGPGTREQKDEAVKRVRTNRLIDDSDEKREKEESVDAAWKHLEDGGTYDTLPDKGAIDGPTLARMETYATKKRAGVEPVTDWALYSDLSVKIANGEMVNPNEYRLKLADAEFKAIVNDVQSAISAKKRGEAMGEAGTLTQQIASAALAGSISKENKGKFQAAARSMIDREAKKLKRDLTFEERQVHIDRLMIEMEVPGTVFDKSRWKLIGTDDERTSTIDSFDDIPASDLRFLKEKFERNGKPWNDDDGEAAYNLYLQGKSAEFIRMVGNK